MTMKKALPTFLFTSTTFSVKIPIVTLTSKSMFWIGSIYVLSLFDINAFLGCMLPVIFIGIVRIRGEYLNSMFVAVVMDGNNNTTPITFGIGVTNNVNSCTWILMRLKDAIGEGREVAFIINMDDIVSSFVGQVFPDTYHGYSSKSVLIYCSLRIGQSTNLDYLFFRACKAYTTQDFQKPFSKLSYDAREVLANIGKTKWAQAYFPNIHWNVLNINIPEFLLVVSVTQRNVPIIMLIDAIVQDVEPRIHPLCRDGHSQEDAKVSTRCVVDLNRHTCSCGKWRSLGITCGQVIVAARYTNNTELTDMVQIYYRADVFRTT
uniref:SWIM-type domain-containing protein n=1 Tax=Lactuca sativa TaxID=4236 RepID=A0A9R1XAI4_LACSA|nr:hypothetical protein LSAT_V11C600315120 [Lactuca sativa]